MLVLNHDLKKKLITKKIVSQFFKFKKSFLFSWVSFQFFSDFIFFFCFEF